ncbi:chitin binding peritrophin-A domain-containing protein [Chitinophaga solisilvae]|uniref:chitin binding peritrophin-A domain-containing protein n=1 Tax=Chitinophaga solisilvae TaxID=1233460 RepID=UPI00136DA6F4|nr:chitin binding peritrophin-A domain-containing protein [Chitinophaga solisilvae]
MRRAFSVFILMTGIALVTVLSWPKNATADGFCQTGQNGYYADPTDCSKFYRCMDGTYYPYTCMPGTVFNPATVQCDWPENVPGCEAGGGTKQCYKNPNDSKNDGNCTVRQDSGGSGAYIMECRTSWSKPNPCETGASI